MADTLGTGKGYKDDSVSEEVSATGQRIGGNIQDAYGSVTGDAATEARGEYNAATGAARQSQNRMVTGLFRDRESAENAYNSIRTRGYNDDDVNLLMSDDTRSSWFGNDADDSALGDKAMEGAGAGSAIGGTLGAVIGAIAAIGTNVVLPGLGLVVAGPIVAALTGAGAGGLTGGLVGALIGAGIPEDRARQYEEGVKNGGVVLGVNPRSDEDADYFDNQFRTHRGESIYR